MELPPKKYVCEKCGYLGNTSEHEGCDYLAWTTGEQIYIDRLELAALRASPASAPVTAPDYRIAERVTDRKWELLHKIPAMQEDKS